MTIIQVRDTHSAVQYMCVFVCTVMCCKHTHMCVYAGQHVCRYDAKLRRRFVNESLPWASGCHWSKYMCFNVCVCVFWG